MPLQALSQDLIDRAQPLLRKTLVHLDPFGEEHNLLLLALSVPQARHRPHRFLPFARVLDDANDCSLRTLYLTRRPKADAFMAQVNAESGFVALMTACQDRKIEVIFEDQAEFWSGDPGISPEFWRRQRILRGSG